MYTPMTFSDYTLYPWRWSKGRWERVHAHDIFRLGSVSLKVVYVHAGDIIRLDALSVRMGF